MASMIEPQSGSLHFQSASRYHLIEGRERPERVVLALHGWGQNGEVMMRRAAIAMHAYDATWVFPDGFHQFEVQSGRRIGCAWYLFDGDQDNLRQSMMLSTERLQLLVSYLETKREQEFQEIAIVGFSQGGYLAGVTASHMDERARTAVCIGGRFKHEFFDNAAAGRLALHQVHGNEDSSVKPELAEKALSACKERGFAVTIETIAGLGHKLSVDALHKAGAWLAKR